MTGLDILPESFALEVLARLDRVGRPLALGGKAKKLDGADQDRASRRAHMVLVAAEPEHNGAEAEHDCGQQPCAPETHVLLNVHHGKLTRKRPDIDEHIKVQEYARKSDVRV